KAVMDRVVTLFRNPPPFQDADLLARLLAGDVSTLRSAPKAGLPKALAGKMSLHLKALLPESDGLDNTLPSHLRGFDKPIALSDLSDGYNSLLCLIGSLFRHALAARDWAEDPAQAYGVVLVDEIDAHLHPSWQRRVLPDLCKVFSRMQVIAT